MGVRLGQLRGSLRHGRDRAPAGRCGPKKKHGVHTSGPAGMYYSVMPGDDQSRPIDNGKQASNLIKYCITSLT